MSLGWCFWHRACYGCLFCGGSRNLVKGAGVGEIFKEPEGSGGGGGGVDYQGEGGYGVEMGRRKAKEVNVVPVCGECLVEIDEDLEERAVERVGAVDRGLARERWKRLRREGKVSPCWSL